MFKTQTTSLNQYMDCSFKGNLLCFLKCSSKLVYTRKRRNFWTAMNEWTTTPLRPNNFVSLRFILGLSKTITIQTHDPRSSACYTHTRFSVPSRQNIYGNSANHKLHFCLAYETVITLNNFFLSYSFGITRFPTILLKKLWFWLL